MLEKLLKRLDLVTLGALLLLLITSGYLYLSEKSYTVTPPDPPPQRQFNVRLPIPPADERDEPRPASNQEQANLLRTLFQDGAPRIDQDPAAARLLRVNMFEIKTAAQREEQREQLNAQLREAEALLRAGSLDQAWTIVEEVLRQDRNHRGAQDMRRQIEQRRAAASTNEQPAP
jgi:hypothetical protein